MIVDRPFIFAIREHLTGALLFLGVVEEPRG
jgi:serine protease inhibitor